MSKPSHRRSRSKHIKAQARDASGTIAWADLTPREQEAFTKAFLFGKARKERLKVLAGVDAGFSEDFAGLLHHYEAAARSEMEVGSWSVADGHEMVAKRDELLSSFKTLRLKTRQSIETSFWMCLHFGFWDKLRWLADYCEARCADGLDKLKDVSPGAFPEPTSRIQRPKDTGVKFAAAMLNSFVQLSGGQDRLLTYPGTPISAQEYVAEVFSGHSKSNFDSDRVPACLPTKKKLGEATLKAWRRLSGAKELDDPASHLSRTIKLLGFSGLPKGSAMPLSKAELSEVGEELREGMDGFH